MYTQYIYVYWQLALLCIVIPRDVEGSCSSSHLKACPRILIAGKPCNPHVFNRFAFLQSWFQAHIKDTSERFPLECPLNIVRGVNKSYDAQVFSLLVFAAPLMRVQRRILAVEAWMSRAWLGSSGKPGGLIMKNMAIWAVEIMSNHERCGFGSFFETGEIPIRSQNGRG